MNEETEKAAHETPGPQPADKTALVKDILQRVAAIESKIDKLTGKRSRAPSSENVYRKEGHAAPRQAEQSSQEQHQRTPGGEKPPRRFKKKEEERPPEAGVYIRKNLRGEHFANKFKKDYPQNP